MKILDVPQSGSTAGTTSSRNRFGQYRRTRAMPTQPRTALQLAIRSQLAGASTIWRTLTQEIRDAWTVYGATILKTDSLGQTYSLTGSQAFASLFLSYSQFGSAPLENPPSGQTPQVTMCVPAFEGIGTTPDLTVNINTDVATCFAMVFASAPCSAGVSFNRNLRRLAVGPVAGGTSVIDVTDAYIAKFGLPPLGSKVFIKVIACDVARLSAVSVPRTASTLAIA